MLDLKLSLLFDDKILWSEPVLEKLLYGVQYTLRVIIQLNMGPPILVNSELIK